jgi:hypothetical protein
MRTKKSVTLCGEEQRIDIAGRKGYGRPSTQGISPFVFVADIVFPLHSEEYLVVQCREGYYAVSATMDLVFHSLS